jgi:hypothetical protein
MSARTPHFLAISAVTANVLNTISEFARQIKTTNTIPYFNFGSNVDHLGLSSFADLRRQVSPGRGYHTQYFVFYC